MSERNTFIFECRSGGSLFWNKNSGDAMFPIFCPYSGGTCSVLCPHINASDEGLLFNCGRTQTQYKGEWKNEKEEQNKCATT